ncbi:hypothetical protein HK104_003830, partial [Borealophlyctis nickersoniae]
VVTDTSDEEAERQVPDDMDEDGGSGEPEEQGEAEDELAEVLGVCTEDLNREWVTSNIVLHTSLPPIEALEIRSIICKGSLRNDQSIKDFNIV